MKKLFLLFMGAVIVTTIATLLVSCEKHNDSSLVGTWKCVQWEYDNVYYEIIVNFESDKTGELSTMPYSLLDDGSKKMWWSEPDIDKFTYSYDSSTETLIMTSNENKKNKKYSYSEIFTVKWEGGSKFFLKDQRYEDASEWGPFIRQ